jgi:long-chain acyl-CoA synthetase
VLGNAWWSDGETAAAIELARPSMLLTDRRARHGLSDDSNILFEEIRAVIEQNDNVPLTVESVDEDAPALVIFSSGTTGHARGVVMSHRSVIANIQNLLLLTGRLPSDLAVSHPGTVSLVSMPLFHLAGIQVSFMTMLTGGKLVFLEGKFEAQEVLQLIEQERVRTWGSVPTMVSRVIQHERFGDYDTSSVSSIQMGGAAIPHELRIQVQQAFPSTRKRVGSMYGFTEAGGVLAAASGSDLEGRPGCVGKPLPSVEIAISSPNADGVGEIVARTPTATTGYLGDPSPICNDAGWVCSGDLGRIDADGFLYVVGRAKDIIIRGGENVASVHVERCLRTHPGVVEAAVVPLPHPDLGEEVGAAIVLRKGARVTVEELATHAALHLAKFEIPSRWWLGYEALPTNASGKIVKAQVIATWPVAEFHAQPASST